MSLINLQSLSQSSIFFLRQLLTLWILCDIWPRLGIRHIYMYQRASYFSNVIYMPLLAPNIWSIPYYLEMSWFWSLMRPAFWLVYLFSHVQLHFSLELYITIIYFNYFSRDLFTLFPCCITAWVTFTLCSGFDNIYILNYVYLYLWSSWILIYLIWIWLCIH